MVTQRLTPLRILVVAAFALTCFSLLLFLWNAFGGGVPLKAQAYRVTVALPESDLLSNQAEVRISGVTIGHVVQTSRTTSTTDPNRKDAVLQIEPRYAPLHRDVRAIIRRKSLAGEMYLELTPGSADAPMIADGGRLPNANVAFSVDFDEVLRTFDPPTRRAFGEWIQAQGAAVGSRGPELNAALGNLPGFAQGLTEVLGTLARQEGAVRAAVSNSGAVFDALGRRSQDLRGVIVNGRRATDALAAQSESFADIWRELPPFERNSRALLDYAERFRRNVDPVITELRPAAREFSATLVAGEPTAKELNGLAHALRPLNAAEAEGLPAARKFLDETRPLIRAFVPFLAQFQPMLAYAEPDADAIPSLIANLMAATQAVTPGDGDDPTPFHYARGTAVLNPQGLAFTDKVLPNNRSNPYPQGRRGWVGGKAPLVFDDRNCGALWFPKLADADGVTDPHITQRLIDGLRHYALNDGQAVAPPCLLQSRPGGRYPHVQPLSQDPETTP